MKDEYWDLVKALVAIVGGAVLLLALGATGSDCGVVILREVVC